MCGDEGDPKGEAFRHCHSANFAVVDVVRLKYHLVFQVGCRVLEVLFGQSIHLGRRRDHSKLRYNGRRKKDTLVCMDEGKQLLGPKTECA